MADTSCAVSTAKTMALKECILRSESVSVIQMSINSKICSLLDRIHKGSKDRSDVLIDLHKKVFRIDCTGSRWKVQKSLYVRFCQAQPLCSDSVTLLLLLLIIAAQRQTWHWSVSDACLLV